MSQKEIRLYDDSVIKLTVKQGLETERFPVTSVGENGNGTYKGNDINILDFNQISSISGSFTTGEMAYTRDTNRLFVGNLSTKLTGSQQQTLGGTLAGNKYLGYVDSRKNYNSEDNGTPLPLSGTDGILSENSPYRSYNFTNVDNGGEIEQTEDKKWQRLSFYNEKYDAYDGDIMYDIYRNAIILFDHNIKPQDGTTAGSATIGGKRKTPLQSRFDGENIANIAEKSIVNKHTSDMYGDGYVLLYNVIPDGDTLTFASRSFNTETGVYENGNDTTPNYSQNVIKVNKVPAPAMMAALDTNVFKFTADTEKITIDLSGVTGSDITGINLENPSISRFIINENSVLKQSELAPADLTNLQEQLENLDELTASVNSHTASISTLQSEVNALKNQGGGGGTSEDLSKITTEAILTAPDYAGASDNLVTTGKTSYTFPADPEGNHYYLHIASVGEFKVKETYTATVSVEDENGEYTGEETTETFTKELTFGSSTTYTIPTETSSITIPVFTEMLIPCSCLSEIIVTGSAISKIIEIPCK